MPFVNIGGVSMHYRHRRAAGEAPALVFINSLGTDFRIWDEVADRLASDVTLLTYDKRGHGLSGLGRGVASMDDHVDDLAGLLDRLGIDDVILCGLPILAAVSQRMSARSACGRRVAKPCAISPPIDSPHRITSSTPRWSRRPARSSTWSSMEATPLPRPDRPWPRLS